MSTNKVVFMASAELGKFVLRTEVKSLYRKFFRTARSLTVEQRGELLLSSCFVCSVKSRAMNGNISRLCAWIPVVSVAVAVVTTGGCSSRALLSGLAQGSLVAEESIGMCC